MYYYCCYKGEEEVQEVVNEKDTQKVCCELWFNLSFKSVDLIVSNWF